MQKARLPVTHADVSPASREALQLIQLIGNGAAVRTGITNHNMLEAGRRPASFAGQDGARRAVERVRKDIEPSVVEVFKAARLIDALFLLCTPFEGTPKKAPYREQ